MLSTQGEEVSARVASLFVAGSTVDPECYESAVGAFAVQLFVNGHWEAVVVDDALPVLGDGF